MSQLLSDPDMPVSSRRQAYYALAVLTLACLCSFVDRHLFTLLVPAIQRDLHITDTQVGLLQGFAFGVFYSVMAIPCGWAVDRYNRRNIVAIGIGLWCVAAIMSGVSHSFTGLLWSRIGIGVGEATLMPAAYSMLADHFPPHERGRALGTFTMAAFIGGGGSYVVGGWVLSYFRNVETVTLPVFGALAVWKAAFIAVGAPGLLIALLMLTVREPVRTGLAALRKRAQGQGSTAHSPNDSILRYVRTHAAAFFAVWGAYTLLTYVSFGINPWAPIMIVRKFGIQVSQVGVLIGIATMVAGVLGAVVSGVLGDRWTLNAAAGGRFRVMMIWSAAVLPAILGFTLSSQARWSVGFFGLYFFINSIGYVSASAVIQEMVPSNLRGRATALWYLITGVVGQGLGPIATALFTDHVFHSQAALPYAIIATVVPGVVICAVMSFRGLADFDRIRKEARVAEAGAAAR